MTKVEGKIAKFLENEETKDIVHFLLEMSPQDLKFWGGLLKKAYEAKLQEKSDVFEALKKEEVKDMTAKLTSENRKLVTENEELTNQLNIERKRKAETEVGEKSVHENLTLGKNIQNPTFTDMEGIKFVEECLKASFKENVKIYKTSDSGNGDIVFKLENNEAIMFEVKDHRKESVKSIPNQIPNFFRHSRSSKNDVKYVGKNQ